MSEVGFRLESERAPSFVGLTGILFSVYGIIMFPMMTYLLLGIDAELTFDPVQANNMWLSGGRWFAAAIANLLPAYLLSYFPIAIFGLCAAVLYALLLRKTRTPATFGAIAAFALFSAGPVWASMLEFATLGTLGAIGLLLCGAGSVALLLTWRTARWTSGLIILQVICVACATGDYQAFLFLYLALGFGTILIGWTSDADTWRRVAVLVLVTISGTILSQIVQFLYARASGTGANYAGGYVHLDLLVADPIGAVWRSIVLALGLYAGSPDVYGLEMWTLLLVVALAIVWVVLGKIAHQGRGVVADDGIAFPATAGEQRLHASQGSRCCRDISGVLRAPGDADRWLDAPCFSGCRRLGRGPVGSGRVDLSGPALAEPGIRSKSRRANLRADPLGYRQAGFGHLLWRGAGATGVVSKLSRFGGVWIIFPVGWRQPAPDLWIYAADWLCRPLTGVARPVEAAMATIRQMPTWPAKDSEGQRRTAKDSVQQVNGVTIVKLGANPGYGQSP